MASTAVKSYVGHPFQAVLPGADQSLTTSGTSQTLTVASTTSLIWVFCTTDAFIKIGASPTASSSTTFLPGGVRCAWGISPGMSIAVIQKTTSGTFYMTEGFGEVS